MPAKMKLWAVKLWGYSQDTSCMLHDCYIPFFCVEIPCDDSSLKDMTTLLMDVQAVVRQLGQIRQIASSCQVEA